MSRRVWVLMALAAVMAAQPKKYDGPQPPKPDLPYLKHADNLVPTDASEAKEEKKKDTTTYLIDGAAAKAQTPLASPIFIMQVDKLVADRIGLYKLDVKSGRRELVSSPKKPLKSIRLDVNRLGGNVYRIEVNESLEPGEYSLSPDGSNQVFCFRVF
jgi:hypothetical protein